MYAQNVLSKSINIYIYIYLMFALGLTRLVSIYKPKHETK